MCFGASSVKLAAIMSQIIWEKGLKQEKDVKHNSEFLKKILLDTRKLKSKGR